MCISGLFEKVILKVFYFFPSFLCSFVIVVLVLFKFLTCREATTPILDTSGNNSRTIMNVHTRVRTNYSEMLRSHSLT